MYEIDVGSVGETAEKVAAHFLNVKSTENFVGKPTKLAFSHHLTLLSPRPPIFERGIEKI